MIKCAKCNKKSIEFELSHDIPKYMGGTDRDGRHWLCYECHDTYERRVLKKCMEIVFNRKINCNVKDRRYLTKYINLIKYSCYYKLQRCQKIAKKIMEDFYGKK